MDLQDVPHLSLPVRISGGAFAWHQQDTVEELATNVGVIVSFPVGSRLEDPEFGIDDPEFREIPANWDDVQDAVAAYEPRAEMQIEQDPVDPLDPTATQVRLRVTMAGGDDDTETVEG
jgi:hypothetical protein